MGSWKTGLFKIGDQSSADVAMRQHRIENRAQAMLQFDIEVDGRKYVRADVTCWFVKRDYPSTTYRPGGSPYRRHRVTLVMQNIAADRGVECRALGKASSEATT